ncbi:MAG: LpxL/LpxP family acyltransferase [Planctomycetota bacterium]|jgi:lauroyl/myristoyl acyltransferase
MNDTASAAPSKGTPTEPAAEIPAAPSPAPRRRRRRFRFRASVIKVALVGVLYRAGKRMPVSAASLMVRAVVGIVRLGYALPFNPLRAACNYAAALGRARGYMYTGHDVYHRFCDQMSTVGPGFAKAYHHGPKAVEDMIPFAPADFERLTRLAKEHGGVVIAVPHNIGGVFASIRLSADMPTVVVAKNQKYKDNERIAKDVFARIGVDAMLVRGKNPVALSRVCLGALKTGKLLVATLDNVYRKPNALLMTFFGLEKIGFAPWAVRFASKRKAPVVPCYVTIDKGITHARFGPELIDRDPERLMRHYTEYLEEWILRDPASWGFLGDRRWRKRLREACEAKGLIW